MLAEKVLAPLAVGVALGFVAQAVGPIWLVLGSDVELVGRRTRKGSRWRDGLSLV